MSVSPSIQAVLHTAIAPLPTPCATPPDTQWGCDPVPRAELIVFTQENTRLPSFTLPKRRLSRSQ